MIFSLLILGADERSDKNTKFKAIGDSSEPLLKYWLLRRKFAVSIGIVLKYDKLI